MPIMKLRFQFNYLLFILELDSFPLSMQFLETVAVNSASTLKWRQQEHILSIQIFYCRYAMFFKIKKFLFSSNQDVSKAEDYGEGG